MYIAHIKGDDKKTQSVAEHNFNTAKLATEFCNIDYLKTSVYLAGLLHDAGKNKPEFLEYIIKASNDPSSVRRGEVKHSFDGGLIISKMSNDSGDIKSFAVEFIREAIISHHGFCFCFSIDGEVHFDRRKKTEVLTDAVCNEVYIHTTQNELNEKFELSVSELDLLVNKIIELVNIDKGKIGSRDFYFGISERMLMSLLIDADRTDTTCFMSGKALPKKMSDEMLKNMWSKFSTLLEKELAGLKEKSSIDIYRKEISQSCLKAAENPSSILRLVVPTGAGKTLSSFRYALKHAEHYCKKRIIYVAPFNSILEQNAKVIRDVIGDTDAILEHHCNIVFDEDGDNVKYKELTSNWNSPIILTTAVQFLNTLFSNKTSSVRRMHSLTEAVIIFDEIQSLPIRCTSLFNLAANYLSVICNSSVVLCSATQPLLDKLEKNSLIKPNDIVINAQKYFNVFKRTEIIDKTDIIPGGLSINDFADFIFEKLNVSKNILVIVNTKNCARNLYLRLKELSENLEEKNRTILFHLSTSMCASHRKSTLDMVRENLLGKKKMICVSTQLIEAGVDISFETVIRSLAGLDSIVQAAGRCNRNCENKSGNVFIVKIADENVSRIIDIKMSQEAMNTVLYTYHSHPELLDNDLLSKKAMDLYFTHYFMNRKSEMNYNIPALDTTIVELLSNNPIGSKNLKKKLLLKQAFKTAGEEFQVIADIAKRDVVVEWNKESKELIADMNSDISIEQQIGILKKLQVYSVSISVFEEKNLLSQSALFTLKNAGVVVLKEIFYDDQIGVSVNPTAMDPYFH